MRKKKLIFAAGGTGGHLHPAQALAKQLQEKDVLIEVLFGGGRLATNPYFYRDLFSFREISSKSPFSSNYFHAAFDLSRGVWQSVKLFRDYLPDLIIGFGSFYSFPLLVAARLKKIPYLLVEANAHPGKVNRLFSASAKRTLIQFEEAKTELKGNTALIKMPIWSGEKKQSCLSKQEALGYFNLDPKMFTLLAFGGSQGADVINQAVISLMLESPFQVIHFCGNPQDATVFQKIYEKRHIRCYVRAFEKRMDLAWQAADLAICRGGAQTIAEILQFQVPSIIIPWPGAAEQHQLKHAQKIVAIGGGYMLEQKHISQLPRSVALARENIENLRENISPFYQSENIEELSEVVLQELVKIP